MGYTGYSRKFGKSIKICQIEIHQIYEAFEKNEHTLGVFIDLSQAFDTVEHSILLKKLELYGITDRNYACIKSYLWNRLQYI